MKLGYDLVIEQSQKLTMTPELIQSIRILQYNSQELNDFISSELLENPVLESKKSAEADKEIDIREKLKESDFEAERFRQFEYSKDDEEDHTYEQYVSKEETLTDYLTDQLQFSKLKGNKAAIGLYIIETIDDNGYLTMSIEEIAKGVNESVDTIREVLDVLQNFEPAGVFASSLSECLTIQLAAKGILSDELDYIVNNMLQDIADNKISKISKKLSLKMSEVQEMVDIIKSLDPKPGRAFASGRITNYVTPDVYIEKIDGEYVVLSNRHSVPKLMISSYYNKLTEEANNDEELKKYLNDKFNSAVWLIKSIEQRKSTILNVTNAILKYQQEFFDKGEKFLKTMTLKQIADELGIHESTVSRTINGKYMQSPKGVYELKYFFTSGVSKGDGSASVSSNSVKNIIKEIISSENPKKPYSDQDIAEMLKEKEIDISRRTVAKYREGMGILSSSKRRRF